MNTIVEENKDEFVDSVDSDACHFTQITKTEVVPEQLRLLSDQLRSKNWNEIFTGSSDDVIGYIVKLSYLLGKPALQSDFLAISKLGRAEAELALDIVLLLEAKGKRYNPNEPIREQLPADGSNKFRTELRCVLENEPDSDDVTETLQSIGNIFTKVLQGIGDILGVGTNIQPAKVLEISLGLALTFNLHSY